MGPRRTRIGSPWARRRLGAITAVPVALLVAGALVWSGTSALFSVSTSDAGNALTAGTVSLSDDDTATAMFTLTGLQRGGSDTKCITVSYGGSVTSAVKLYVSASSGTLRSSLNVTVEEGTGGSFASCSGFAASSTVYSGTLSAFASASSTWATGVGGWSPTGAGQSRVYRITSTLSASAPASAQNTSAAATFTWEARST